MAARVYSDRVAGSVCVTKSTTRNRNGRAESTACSQDKTLPSRPTMSHGVRVHNGF